MQAVVGFHAERERALYMTPFQQEDVTAAEDCRTQLNTLRECGAAVWVLGMDTRFDRAAADSLLRQATYAAWVAVRGDLSTESASVFLTSTLHKRPLVPIHALRGLSAAQPVVLSRIMASLLRPPYQEQRTGLLGRRRGAAAASTLDDDEALTADTPLTASVPTGSLGSALTRDSISKVGLVCMDSSKTVTPSAKLMDVIATFFTAGYTRTAAQYEVFDAFLALLHRLLIGAEKTDSIVPAKFACEELQKEHEHSRHAGVLVWHVLLSCARPYVRQDVLLALFKLFQPCFGRTVARAMTHAHVLVLVGVFAHLIQCVVTRAAPEIAFTCGTADLHDLPPVPAWLEGPELLSPACVRYWKAQELIWQATQGMLSERRLVAEVQAQLPGIFLARGACAFSDRRVQVKFFAEDIELVEFAE